MKGEPREIVAAHRCHARGCTTKCRPEYLMCRKHWAMVPTELRADVWRHYRAGQCQDKKPSREWLAAAGVAIDAVAAAEQLRAGTDRQGQLKLD